MKHPSVHTALEMLSGKPGQQLLWAGFRKWSKWWDDIGTDESRLCSSKPNHGTLQISCVKKSDQGHYRCLVKSPVELSGTSSYKAKLAVCKFAFSG